ncbi:DUF3102 domain-containing protein [Rhizobium rhizogenes]|uniref:DUF3102 domain-containing protein n=1 Tax=Rhizobium rhizogenes TaxID=359 RepID=UPI0022C82A1E|nr:DUF3102 domain-containing protein [Rhizobium rhizogenes]MCZ7488209.1 DUF3102 domain-containing protein [Rhizobium rhizogenes]
MSNLIDVGFDYAVIDEDGRDKVKEAAVRIRLRMSRTVEDIIEIGRDLIAVKKSVGHGKFTRWIEAEFGMSENTARNFMRACERFGDKTATVADLGPSVLYALAAPSTDDAVVEEVIDRASNGETVTREDVSALKAEFASERKDLKKQIEEAKTKAKDAQATGIDYGQQIEQLRSELYSLRGERDTLLHELNSAKSSRPEIKENDIKAQKTERVKEPDEAKGLTILKDAWASAGEDERFEFLKFIGARAESEAA